MMHVSIRMYSCIAVLAAFVGYLVVSLLYDDNASAANDVSNHPVAPPFVMYRALEPGAYGRLAILPLAPGASSRISGLACSRLHYAGGRGLCAVQEAHVGRNVSNVAYVFDRSLTRGRRIPLDGIPTRLRVSPNGYVGAITTYAEEESPEGERLVSRTRVVDLQKGVVIADLSDFRLEQLNPSSMEGPVDMTGVTFERGADRFFATAATPAERYLIAGSLRERRLSVIRSGIAAESLSPDGTKLVAKRLIRERGFWQLVVIDLQTWAEHDLPQGPRSVDDQVEWFDEDHVVYHDADHEGTSLWLLPVDGSSGPRVLIKDAYSGVVQR
jgi:hypothetical protein